MTTKRLRYFNGQFLKQEDFTDEQAYHLSMRRRHNTGVHTAGVVAGLEVEASETAGEVVVATGWAVDREGREIILGEQVTLVVGTNPPYFVTCAYQETPADPQAEAETGIVGDRRVAESARIELVQARPDGILVLAEINRPGGSVVVADQRTFSGMDLPGNLTVQGNLEVQGQTTLIQADQMRGNVVLGDEDIDTITVEGTLLTGHSTGKLQIAAPVNLAGDLTVTGNTVLGDADTDIVTVEGTLQTGHSSTQLRIGSATAITGGLSVSGAAQVGGNLTVQGNLEVQGQTTLIQADQMRGNTVLGDADTDTVTVEGTLLTGHSTGKLQIAAPVNLAGDLTVTGNTVLGDADTDTVTIEGRLLTGHSSTQLQIGSATAISGALSVSGAAQVGGNLTVQGNLEVQGQTTLIQADQMRGNVVLGDEDTDTVTVEGTMITGHSSGQLRIGSPVTVSNGATVTGPAQFANTVAVTGPAQFANSVSVTGLAQFTGMSVTGAAQFAGGVVLGNADTDTVTVEGALLTGHSSGQLMIGSATTVAGSLSVSGAAQVGGNLTVQGNLEVQGQTVLVQTDQMRGNVVLGDEDADTVTVEGTMITGHSSGQLRIGSATNVAGNLTVQGGLTASGALSAASATLSSRAGIGPFSTATLTGQLSVAGAQAELSFADRALVTWPATPVAGDRFTWYAYGKSARLWTPAKGDLLTVTGNGNVYVGAPAPVDRYLLEVAGRMRVRPSVAESAGIWFSSSYGADERAFAGMADDNTVGLYGGNGAGWGLTMNTVTGAARFAGDLVVEGTLTAAKGLVVDASRIHRVPLLQQTLFRRPFATVGGLSGPWGVAFDGTYLWVANRSGNSVSKIDIGTNAVVATVPGLSGPWGVAFDGTYLWVVNYTGNSVSKIDIGTNAVVATVPGLSGPRYVAFDGAHLWVANNAGNSVSKIDIGTNAVVATVPGLSGPYGVAFDGTHLWVTNMSGNSASKIDIGTNAVVATVGGLSGPYNAAFDGTHLWVVNYTGNSASKIDIGTNAVVATVGGLSGPFGVAFDGTHLWVTNLSGNSASKIDVGTNAVVATVPGLSAPYNAAFEGANIWVSSYGANSVAKIRKVV